MAQAHLTEKGVAVLSDEGMHRGLEAAQVLLVASAEDVSREGAAVHAACARAQAGCAAGHACEAARVGSVRWPRTGRQLRQGTDTSG
jgi:hypothetical protein